MKARRATLIGKSFCYGGKVYRISEVRATAFLPGSSSMIRSVKGERKEGGLTVECCITNSALLSMIGNQINNGEDVADLKGYEPLY